MDFNKVPFGKEMFEDYQQYKYNQKQKGQDQQFWDALEQRVDALKDIKDPKKREQERKSIEQEIFKRREIREKKENQAPRAREIASEDDGYSEYRKGYRQFKDTRPEVEKTQGRMRAAMDRGAWHRDARRKEIMQDALRKIEMENRMQDMGGVKRGPQAEVASPEQRLMERRQMDMQEAPFLPRIGPKPDPLGTAGMRPDPLVDYYKRLEDEVRRREMIRREGRGI